MFTGLVEEIGTVKRVEPRGDIRRFVINATKILDDLKVDDSVAVNGVCLTAVTVNDTGFEAEAVSETLSKTTLAMLQTGHRVNLERSLRPSDRMGGHFVQGHVDAVAQVVRAQLLPGSWQLTVRIPEQLLKYVIPAGSIAIDGVSLTVARLQGDEATVALIPHTLKMTNLEALSAGSHVNIEVDLIGKYIERILTQSGSTGGITESWLKNMGYEQS